MNKKKEKIDDSIKSEKVTNGEIAPKRSKQEIFKSLRNKISSINKKYGKTGSHVDFASNYYQETCSIPTGFSEVDKASGIGGIPKSGIIELYGVESVGKSYLAQHIVQNAQKSDDRACLYADLEGGLELKNMANIGINVDELIRLDFDIAETIFEQIKELIESGLVSTVILDSVAALHPKMDANADYQDSLVASKARLMSRVMPELAMLSKKYNVLVVLINQLRNKIGSYGNPEDTPGGKAIKYFSHMRIECKFYYPNDEQKRAGMKTRITAPNGDIIGQRVNVKFVKNKFAPPLREGMFELYFANQDIVRSIIFTAKKHKMWFVRGGVYNYDTDSGSRISSEQEEDFVNELILSEAVVEMLQKLIEKEKNGKEKILPDKFDMSVFVQELEKQKIAIFEQKEDQEEKFENFDDVLNPEIEE